MQPAALRGASDVNSRTGDRRPRPRALCCTKKQLPIHPLLRLPGRRSAVPARPRPHTDHPFGLSTGSPLATGSPHLSAGRRAFSLTFFVIERHADAGISNTPCTGDEWVRPAEAAVHQPGSGSLSGGLVLLGHARGDTPAVADRDALVLRPGPDVRATLPACYGPPGPPPLPPARLAGVLDIGRQLPAERSGVLCAQLDLVLGTAKPESHRL